MKPDVSITLTTYNRPIFLREAIDSVLAQTLKNLELVIVDDGSQTMETEKICRHYVAADQRVKYVRQENAGLPAARNRGVQESSADFITFMDDDDISHHHRLEKQLGFIKQNPSLAAVTCNNASINELGEVTQRDPVRPPLIREKSQSLQGITRAARPFMMSQNTLIHRNIYIKEGGYDERFRIMEDLEFGLRLEEKYATGRIHEDLYFHRVHNNGSLFRDPKGWGYHCAIYVDAYFRRLGKPLPANYTLTDLLGMVRELPPPMVHDCTLVARKMAKYLLRQKNYPGLSFLLSQSNATLPNSQQLKTKLYGRLLLWVIYYGKFGGLPTVLKNMTKQHK